MKTLFFLIAIAILTACHSSRREQYLPFFELLLSDSATRLNTAMIPEGKPTILLYFNPDSVHCQHQIASILQAMDSLKAIRFYFITTDSFSRMKIFSNSYKLSKYPNITLARDLTSFFPGYFNRPDPPYLVIYDQHKRQKGVFAGGISATQIIEFVNNL